MIKQMEAKHSEAKHSEENMKLIKGFNNQYSVTTDGKVWSKRMGGFLKIITDKKGYSVVSLYKDRKKKVYKNSSNKKICKIHRLVAMCNIPNPLNKPQVNHIDGDKSNNNVNNLEWNTAKENMQHAIKLGLYTPKKCGMCREITLVNDLTNENETYFSISEFSRINNYPVYSVRTCLNIYQKYKHYALV
tara:strand:- start:531 stop:1097 length:567 start_codon:yes stop_codon:yes gene_type:complete